MCEEVQEVVVLDCTGLLCPVPIHLTAKRMVTMPCGGRLAVLADDEVITQDMPSWCTQTGHRIIEHRHCGGSHRYVIEKSAR